MGMTLNGIGSGKCVEVKNLEGGEVMCKRLMEMGVNKGALIEVIKNDVGPIIIGLGKTRYALGRGMAQRVMVEEI